MDYGVIIAVGSAAAGIIAWFWNYSRASYARERKLGHIERALREHNQNVATLCEENESALKEIDRKLDDIGDRLLRIELAISYRQQQGIIRPNGERLS